MLHSRHVSAGIGVTICAMTVNAWAEGPSLQISWMVNGELVETWFPPGTYNPAFDWWSYEGFTFDPVSGVMMVYSLNGSANAPLLLGGGFTVENPLLPSVDVVLQATMSFGAGLAGTNLLGSAALGMTADSGGGTLASLAETPLWQGVIDGSPVGDPASMFFHLFELSSPGLGSAGTSSDFGLTKPVPGPPVSSTVGIKLTFSLTQYDQFSTTGVFVAVSSSNSSPACPWDLDNSGAVDIVDMLEVVTRWGIDHIGPPDFNGDLTVGIVDLLDLLANWGPCPQ